MMKPNRIRRSGLAPLEFVLWLPVFLFVTALMVNFGTVAAWRLRGEVVSRDAVWRVRWPRTGASEPRPQERIWPKEATVAFHSDVQVSSIDLPAIQHPVVRGTLSNDFVVYPTLDPDRQGALKGISAITRAYPLLPKLGPYRSGEIENSLLDEKWQVAQMGVYTNRTRRIPYIYQLPKTDPSLPDRFVDAVHALFMMTHFATLDVLDRDEELRDLIGYYWDFHPTVRSLYRTDPAEVRQLAVKPLVDRIGSGNRVELGYISHRPREMTNRFLGEFQQAIDSMQQQIDGLQQQLNATPVPGPQQQQAIQARIQSLQSQIDVLTPKVKQLEAYRDQLSEIEAGLRQRYLLYLNAGG